MKIERPKFQVLDQMMADVNELGIIASKLVAELSVNGEDVDLDIAYAWMARVAELRRTVEAVRLSFCANDISGLIDLANNKDGDEHEVVYTRI